MFWVLGVLGGYCKVVSGKDSRRLYAEKAYIVADGIKYHAFAHKKIPRN